VFNKCVDVALQDMV